MRLVQVRLWICCALIGMGPVPAHAIYKRFTVRGALNRLLQHELHVGTYGVHMQWKTDKSPAFGAYTDRNGRNFELRVRYVPNGPNDPTPNYLESIEQKPVGAPDEKYEPIPIRLFKQPDWLKKVTAHENRLINRVTFALQPMFENRVKQLAIVRRNVEYYVLTVTLTDGRSEQVRVGRTGEIGDLQVSYIALRVDMGKGRPKKWRPIQTADWVASTFESDVQAR